MNRVILYVALFCVFASSFNNAFALSVTTHEAMNKYIVINTIGGFSLDSYFRNITVFTNGVNEIVDKDYIYKIIEKGGRYEDIPPSCIPYDRSRHHFHNPLTEQGFSGVFLGYPGGMSAVLWAQLDTTTQMQYISLCGDNYSWKDVRNYYFSGLTSLDNNYREIYLAKAFRGIGQLMHLVQDMSVPEHTRDDLHILPLHDYESWVADVKNKPKVDNLLSTPYVPDNSLLFRPSAFANATLPFANLFDTNQYDGADPNVTLRSDIGLSEYTNANFFSDDTILTPEFPYPSLSQLEAYDQVIDNTTGDSRVYLRKLKDQGGQLVEHIAHVLGTRGFYGYLPDGLKRLALRLDKIVYEDYAKELIPRAVGYSAEIMNYFFRGDLEVSKPDENVYSVIDGSVSQSFGKIKAKVKNNTPGEEAGNGTIYAVAKYKIRSNYLPDLSNDPPGPPAPEVPFSYSVSAPVTIDNSIETLRLKANAPNSYLFDFSASPIPAGITDLTLMVVFKGTLGYEPDSAIAVGSVDLMEPAHHVYFNLTDMFSLNGHLYTAQQIRDNTSLLSQVGTAYIDPYPMTVAVSYVNQAPPMPINTPEVDVAVADLSPGYHFELIVLVENNNYIRVTEADNIDPGFDTRYTAYIGLRNQYYGGVWTSTPNQLLLFRHDAAGNTVRSNFHTGWLRCTPYGEGYCPYPENEAIVPLPGISPVPVQILGDFGL